MVESTDEELIGASLEDSALFGVVFDRHFAAIHRYLARRVSKEVADDLAAETFLIAFRRRESFESTCDTARPWLFGIATNLARGHCRSELRMLKAYARSGVDPVAVEHGYQAAEDRADASAAGPVLASALAALNRRDRDALLLYVWGELSYTEVAAALAIPVGTVRSRLARARTHLREHLLRTGQVLDDATATYAEASDE